MAFDNTALIVGKQDDEFSKPGLSQVGLATEFVEHLSANAIAGTTTIKTTFTYGSKVLVIPGYLVTVTGSASEPVIDIHSDLGGTDITTDDGVLIVGPNIRRTIPG